MKKHMSRENFCYSRVWDLSYALTNPYGEYKKDAYGRIMIYDHPHDDSSIIDLPEPDKLEWRDDHYDYTYEPKNEIGIVLRKEDIDPDNELTDAQWLECVGRFNRGKVDIGSIVEEIQDACEVIVDEMEVSE
jgi:hypothetical protein